MTNTYRALCAELADAVEQARQALEGWANYGQWVWPESALEQAKRNTTEALASFNRARALLAQPVAEGPTDEELLRVAATAIEPYESSGIPLGEYEPETECAVEAYGSELIAYAREVLHRWGHPTPQPVAEGVLPLKERHDFIAGYREGLADGRRIIECEEAERPTPQPVAVSERLPGPADPITPPDELLEQWLCSDDYLWGPLEHKSITITANRLQNVATQAANWGANQELEACCDYIGGEGKWFANPWHRLAELRTARRPKPPSLKAQPVAEEGDIHYVWELHDAKGEWQAGGSANSLEDVQREGNRYLQTYKQYGPHKLIIQRHCVSTIESESLANPGPSPRREGPR